MSATGLLQRIQSYNHGRDPERLHLKYQAMQRNPFAFLRGTGHLFYEDWPPDTLLNAAPLTWICGDLHLENFGTYKGDNQLTYFDINDFDEATLAPATWDLARFLTSVLVAAHALELSRAEALMLGRSFLEAYRAELTEGKARWIERATAQGMIRDLLKGLKKRSRPAFIQARTRDENGQRRLRVDGKKALPVSEHDCQKVIGLMERFASTHPQPDAFRVLDVARRVAGISSLGIERYVIMIHGQGGRKGHYLLDLKYQPGSALKPYLQVPQPSWGSEAERVVTLQKRVQAIAPAFLSVLTQGQQSYVLKELMPQQDRLCLEQCHGKVRPLAKIMATMGQLVAWGHERSSGRQGSAIGNEWVDFGHRSDWQQSLLDYADGYSQKVVTDWRDFRNAIAQRNEP